MEISHKHKTIIVAAGGTGGHMIPAEAVAVELQNRGHHVILITDPRGDAYPGIMEGFDRFVLSTSGIGGGLMGKVKGTISLVRETAKCRRYLQFGQADMVIGFGGYPSMPVVAAAKTLGIPYILHEQNTVLGRVNRLMAKGAVAIALSYENTKRVPDNVEFFVTGNPVRRAVLDHVQPVYDSPGQIDPFNLLIMGGSQGASILSNVIPKALAALDYPLKTRLNIVHQAREEDLALVAKTYQDANINYTAAPYFVDMPARLAKAHLVLSRAGASSLSEISVLGIPSILVPLKIAMDDHQTGNAVELAKSGAASLMSEDNFTPEKLQKILSSLLIDTEQLKAMAVAARKSGMPDSAIKLADMVEKISERL